MKDKLKLYNRIIDICEDLFKVSTNGLEEEIAGVSVINFYESLYEIKYEVSKGFIIVAIYQNSKLQARFKKTDEETSSARFMFSVQKWISMRTLHDMAGVEI